MSNVNNTSPFQMNSVQTANVYIADLHKEHDKWHEAEKSASEQLVSLLVKCLRLYELMAGESAEADTLRTDFAAYVKSTKLRFNSATHTVAKIAGVVFNRNDDKYNRRHASHYGSVLRRAISESISSDKLSTYIASNGGVTKIAAGNSTQAVSTEDRATAAWTTLKASNVITVAGNSFAKDIDAANVGQRVVLLATQRANATFDVHAVVQNSSLVDAAFASKHEELKKAASNTNTTSSDLDTARARVVANAKS